MYGVLLKVLRLNWINGIIIGKRINLAGLITLSLQELKKKCVNFTIQNIIMTDLDIK